MSFFILPKYNQLFLFKIVNRLNHNLTKIDKIRPFQKRDDVFWETSEIIRFNEQNIHKVLGI